MRCRAQPVGELNFYISVIGWRLNRSSWAEHDASWCRETSSSNRRRTPTSSTYATRPTSASRTVAPGRSARTAASATGRRAASTAASSCAAVAGLTSGGGECWNDATASFTGAATSSVRDVGASSKSTSVDKPLSINLHNISANLSSLAFASLSSLTL